MAAPPSRRASPPVLPDELVEEILLRLPPEDPACLVRASLVCKTWGCAVSRPIFRRLLHEHHGTAPVLGFLHNWPSERIPNFMPTTASPFSLAAPDRRVWQAVDCRHGRALYLSEYEDQGEDTQELLVWEPITGRQRRVFLPAAFNCRYPNAAVFCAADACDHRDCHGGPFCVVLVFRKSSGSDEYDSDDDEHLTSACVYSSDTDTWGEPTSTHVQFAMDFGIPPYGDASPEFTDMDVALPYETQAMPDPMGDVSKDCMNEELVKSSATNSKDDTANQEVSGSNVDDAHLQTKVILNSVVHSIVPFPRPGGDMAAPLW